VRGQNIQSAIPIVIAALNGPDQQTAGAAALFLGAQGTITARSALLQRLQAFRTEWHERVADDPGLFEGPHAIGDPLWNAVEFEKSLVSALAHAKNWSLTKDEMQTLADGCFTDECRQMADGKSWISF
jgi:hypothetical protein